MRKREIRIAVRLCYDNMIQCEDIMRAGEYRVEGTAAYGVMKAVISLALPFLPPTNIYIGVVEGCQM